jgi:hypothetical protein
VAFYYSDTPPAENALPAMAMLEQIETPEILEYWIQMLPVKALSRGAILTNGNCKDEESGRNYHVYKLEGSPNQFVKFELDVPAGGDYKLYMSYFQHPETGHFDINQRQVPVMQGVDGYAAESKFVEKAFIGDISIEEGTNTITVMLKKSSENRELNTFMLHRLYLEKVNG